MSQSEINANNARNPGRNVQGLTALRSLSVEKNRTIGHAPKVDQRPAHPMLRVNVTKLQRAACLRDLAAALGAGAVLLGTD